jgi:hypothetical protein
MANFAVIQNNIVVDLIIAESEDIATSLTGLQCVQYGEEERIGRYWEYDGTKFTNPNPPVSIEERLGIDTTGSD